MPIPAKRLTIASARPAIGIGIDPGTNSGAVVLTPNTITTVWWRPRKADGFLATVTDIDLERDGGPAIRNQHTTQVRSIANALDLVWGLDDPMPVAVEDIQRHDKNQTHGLVQLSKAAGQAIAWAHLRHGNATEVAPSRWRADVLGLHNANRRLAKAIAVDVACGRVTPGRRYAPAYPWGPLPAEIFERDHLAEALHMAAWSAGMRVPRRR